MLNRARPGPRTGILHRGGGGWGGRKDRERAQQPEWPDKQALVSVEAELERLPPLVFAGEVDRLQKQLAEAALGRAFVLQASDCAEPFNSSFAGSPADSIRD